MDDILAEGTLSLSDFNISEQDPSVELQEM